LIPSQKKKKTFLPLPTKHTGHWDCGTPGVINNLIKEFSQETREAMVGGVGGSSQCGKHERTKEDFQDP